MTTSGAAGSGANPATPVNGKGDSTASGKDGSSGAAGSGGATAAAGSGAPKGTGMCCSDGDCICRGEVPAELSARNGPFKITTARGERGTVYYPSDAEPPFAGLAITPGFLNSGPEVGAWGEFYASWGIVTHVTSALASDPPEIRAQNLLGGIAELKSMNSGKGPLAGKLSGRYGISGYSYGGGGATIGASRTPDLATSVGLAAFGGTGRNTKAPTLVFCGEVDTVAGCFMSDSVYGSLPEDTPKMYISVPGASHFSWFGPADAGGGTSGKYALAFQKVFLERDERWKPLLLKKPSGGEFKTNIK